MTGPAIPSRPEGSPPSPPPSPAPEAPRTDPAEPTPQPARPRIRPAQSEKWDREPEPSPAASVAAAAPASGPAAGTPGGAAGAHPGLPQGYWSSPAGQLYYRAADGQDYYQASDGKFYPVAALLAQQPAGTAAAAAAAAQTAPPAGATPADASAGYPAPGASAADDRSTYYEYIAAHTGEQRIAQDGSPAGPPDPAGSRNPAGPPGPHRRRRTGMTVVAAIAATVLVAVAVFLGLPLLSPNEDLKPSEEPSAEDTGTGSGETSVPAAEQLKELAQNDHATVASKLDGHWVVQLSAKQEGLTTEQQTWTNEAILEEFETLRAQHPEALLLNSSQWSSFRLNDYWITVLNEPYDDPEAALAKCRELGIDRDNCFAKKISSTEGPEGTTKLNP
ncbi:hypothetical protein [Brevibacterium luteolum]|uniref:hypothetical protein n=1 Tax=Brevibacterium luteolum TaxID=199591 RepID=UPI001C23068A|nr:hypothetical protein [Brevibacterium luteolum]MBU8579457.1 hypothetical protein [Brevibacterium luteolum]